MLRIRGCGGRRGPRKERRGRRKKGGGDPPEVTRVLADKRLQDFRCKLSFPLVDIDRCLAILCIEEALMVHYGCLYLLLQR